MGLLRSAMIIGRAGLGRFGPMGRREVTAGDAGEEPASQALKILRLFRT